MPANGDRPHRFTELTPREEARHDACETCERPVHLHEGPLVARCYQFVARGIAEALVAVGAGTSDRQAGLVALCLGTVLLRPEIFGVACRHPDERVESYADDESC